MTTFNDTILFYVNGVSQQANSGDTISISRNLTIASPSTFSVGVNISFASGFAPTISQTSTSTTSGAALTVQAQNATGATHNGGNLNLTSGTSGAATVGTVNIQTGGTTQLAVSPTVVTISEGLTQSGGAVSLTGNAASSFTTSSSTLSLDAAAALNLGTSTATSIAIGKSGITTTVTGGLSQLTGAVSLAGNAASSFTTSSGALTLNGNAGLTLQVANTTNLTLSSSALQWASTITTPTFNQIAPASSGSTGAAGTTMSIVSQAGGATTGSSTTAGNGGTFTIAGGAGGSGAGGTNANGGIGGGLTITSGVGGSKNGTGLVGSDGYLLLQHGGTTEAFISAATGGVGFGIGTTPGVDPTISRGTGVPATTQPNGSLFMRTDGTSVTALYSMQSGVWNSVSNSGITALTGDVTATGPGSVAATVASISGSSPIAITPSNLQWASATTTPKLNQADNTTNSATAATLTIQAQNATGTTANGGTLNLSSGSGTNNTGVVNLLCGGTSILTCNTTTIVPGVNTWQWPQSATGPNLSQAQSTAGVGKNFTISAQQGASGSNSNGGNLLLDAGSGGGTGLGGAVRLQLPSTSNVMLEVTQLASTSKIVSLCANGLALTTTQMPTNSGNGVIFLAGATANPSANCNNTGIVLYTDSAHFNFTSRDNIGTVADMTYFSAGTVNTQVQKQLKFVQYGRIATTGSTLTISIPLATATTNCNLEVNTIAKIATAGSLNAAGDTFNDNKIATFKNVSGTVTQVGSSVDLTASQSDASLSTSAITFTISGTNIVVTFTANATSGTLGNCDVTMWVTQTIN